MDEIREKLLKCLDNNGIDLNEDSKQIDSISFITAIVDIEQEFDVEFPDEYLLIETMSSFEKIYDIVELLVTNKSN